MEPMTLSGINLYAYCDNNPVVYEIGITAKSNEIGNIGITNSYETSTSAHKSNWQNSWFVVKNQFNLAISENNLTVIDCSISVYQGTQEGTPFVISVGNVGVFAGLDFEKGIGFFASANLAEFSYELGAIGASVEVLSAGVKLYAENGKVKAGIGLGVFGVSISIDFSQIWEFFGG